MLWIFGRKEEQAQSWEGAIAAFEDRLLRIGRWHFIFRALMFFSICCFAVVYKCVPVKGAIVGEVFLLFVLWIVDAIFAKNESVTYNEYVQKTCPAYAKQVGFKMAPVRGFWSCFLFSWDVTLFYVPFVVVFLAITISPNRVSEDLKENDGLCSDGEFDARIVRHIAIRHRNIISLQKCRSCALTCVCTNLWHEVRDDVLNSSPPKPFTH